MDNTLSWLDNDNHDDRIIASVLEGSIQGYPILPQSRYLVTGDINLYEQSGP